MAWQRALIVSVISYVCTFAVGFGALLVLGDPFVEGGGFPPAFFALQIVLSAIVGTVGAWWYFKSGLVIASATRGAVLGLSMVGFGFLLDLLTFMPALFDGYALSALLVMYTEPLFWVALSLVVATATLVGFLRARGAW